MTTAIITAYIVGVIVSYLFYRWIYSDNWTISQKTISILKSLFSWVLILLTLFFAFQTYIKECLKNNNKAKW